MSVEWHDDGHDLYDTRPLAPHEIATISSPDGDVITEGRPDGYREQFAVVWMRSGWTGPASRAYMKRERAEDFYRFLLSPLNPDPLAPLWANADRARSDPSTLEWVRIDVRLIGPWHKGDLLPLETEPSGPGQGLVRRRGVSKAL